MSSLVVTANQVHLRLDAIIAEACPDWSRAQIKHAIDKGHVAIDGKTCLKAGKKCFAGELITWTRELSIDFNNPGPEPMNLDILYEDAHLIVLNKPCGLVVHPGAGHLEGTLVNGLLAHDAGIAGIGEPSRPGIVHRLDAETSGLMLAARSSLAYERLVEMFACHAVMRQYWALCHAPRLPDVGVFDTGYGRHLTQRIKYTSKLADAQKRAVTHYRLLCKNAGGYALITCNLETGRTHQVRVHLSEHGAPIVGDSLYAPAKLASHRCIDRLALHAGRLSLQHPITGAVLAFEISLPEDMQRAMSCLGLHIDEAFLPADKVTLGTGESCHDNAKGNLHGGGGHP